MTHPVPFNDPMLTSAKRLLADAMSAWAERDPAKILMLAPIAAEHLCKSALWHRNPVLLAQLDPNHEKAFLALATKPDLNDESLRTIGLAASLARVARVHEVPPPLSDSRIRRLVECRGGAVHVGQFTLDNAEHVLADVLTIFDWLAPHMGVTSQALFGVNSETAGHLLDNRRSNNQRAVDRRLAAARGRFQRLVESVGPDLLQETVAQKEALASSQVSRLITDVAVGTETQCPACSYKGLLVGELETEHDVDVEGGPDGVDNHVSTEYRLLPDSFLCNVCGLVLQSADELELCGLPSSLFTLPDEEITPGLVAYARDREAWLTDGTDEARSGSS